MPAPKTAKPAKAVKSKKPSAAVASTSNGVPQEVASAYAARAERGSQCNWIFEVDYAINSKRPRFFVYNVNTREFFRYKTAHGVGGKNASPHDGKCREVSNVPGSECSSLGVIVTGEPYTSEKVGKALRLDGKSSTNSNIRARGVVLHGGTYVQDNASNTDATICGRSHGCIVVDDQYISKTGGGELIKWLRDGSIGVAHHGGKFKVG